MIVHLFVPQACPFLLEVFTEDCEGEIEIIDLLPSAPIVNPAFSQVVVEKGVATPVKGGEESLMSYIFTTPYLTTIAVENKVYLPVCTYMCVVCVSLHAYIHTYIHTHNHTYTHIHT